jgi:hypothetical protein
LQKLKGVISIVCFNRLTELKLAIDAVEKSKLSNQNILIVCQKGNPEVENYVTALDELIFEKIFTPEIQNESTKQVINRNVHTALKVGFLQQADYVVLIEDDIQIHPTFLKYVDQLQMEKIDDSNFRGINGFSASQQDPKYINGYGKFRFGVGWGWSINVKVWNEISVFWKGTENAHWDGLIEPFMRCGYVTMPNTSLIRNHGLDGKGSNSADDPELSHAISQSFEMGSKSQDTTWTLHQSDINWREDCFTYLPTISPRGRFIDLLFKLLFIIRSRNEEISYENRVKSKIKSMIFRFIGKMV